MAELYAAVIGLGYVGQPLVAALASVGYVVYGVDVDEEKVRQLATMYQPTLFEPGVAETFARCRDHIHFTTSYEEAMRVADVLCITVGTPVGPDGHPVIAALDGAVRSLGQHLRPGQTIILRSTVLPGTTTLVAGLLEQFSGLRAGTDFYVAYCPERTIEGIALYELYNLPAIIGGLDRASTERTVAFFERLGTRAVVVSSPMVAELCKLTDNMYRALNIAFANELGNICEGAKVDAYEVVRAVNAAYPRTQVFRPGLGADGPCLSKDPLILHRFAESARVGTPLIDAAVAINRDATLRVAHEVHAFLMRSGVREPRITVLGLAFKGMPETDDIRGSAALAVYDDLTTRADGAWRERATFSFFDPIVRDFYGNAVCAHLDASLRGAHVVLFLSDHPSLRNVPLHLLLEHTARPLLVVDAWHNVAQFRRSELPSDVTYVRIGDGV